MIIEPNDTILEANDTGITSAAGGSFVDDGFIGDNPATSSGENDVDILKVQIDAGDLISIDIDASVNGSSLDSILRVFNSAGNEVAVNDDFDGLDSFIRFSPSVTDTYYIGVSSFANFDYNPFVVDSGSDGFSSGEYTISIDLVAALDGTGGNDILIGTPNFDLINGLGGNDVLQGRGGDDILSGGNGNDTIGGQDGADSLVGGNGSDILAGGDDSDTVEGSVGNDELSGGGGIDFLIGGENNDFISGDSGDDQLNGNNGRDSLFGGNGSDFLEGNSGGDRLFGDNGSDFLSGDAGNDTLRGGLGRDNLFGGSGNDVLQGDSGNDFLTGGSGADQFVLESDQGGETITDFQDDIDQFVLGQGLNFANLSILAAGENTVIVNDNLVLAVVENTETSSINVEDFVFL